MMKVLRFALAVVLTVAGSVIAVAPASAAGCQVAMEYNVSAIWVEATPSGCSGTRRAVLYYYLTPSGPTMYSARGLWVTNGYTSKASTSSNRYFAGAGYEVGA